MLSLFMEKQDGCGWDFRRMVALMVEGGMVDDVPLLEEELV